MTKEQMAQEHYDKRAKLFDMNDFDKETIAVESWKLGYEAADAGVQELVEALTILSENSNFCMGEYVGPIEKYTLRSDVVIAQLALAGFEKQRGQEKK